MHRLTERPVTYLWLTITLALIAGLAITLTTSQSQAKTRNDDGHGGKAHRGLSQRSVGEQCRLERGDRAPADRGIHGRRSAQPAAEPEG